MTILCLTFVGLAVLLLMAPPASRRTVVEAAVEESPSSRRISARAWWVAAMMLAVVAIALTRQWAGAPAAVASTAAVIVAATAVRLLRGYLAARAATRAEHDVAEACAVLAAHVRVGRVPAEALRSAGQDCPVLVVAGNAQDLGGDVAAVWQAQSTLRGHDGLAVLARAWRVSAQTGAPLAHNLDQVAQALTAEMALRAVVAGELAAARATGKIMAALPLCGVGMGYLLGGDPLHFLLRHPLGWACLVAGIGLAAAGVLWIDKLAAPTGP